MERNLTVGRFCQELNLHGGTLRNRHIVLCVEGKKLTLSVAF